MLPTARAFWLVSPGHGEIRTGYLPGCGPGEVQVRTLYSALSRGTESLVHRGGVPESQYALMRAPFQQGDLPGPVKYGYLNVGVVENGPPELMDATVFCLYPHQDRYVVPAAAVTPVPDGVPAARAVLAGTVETAVNALWDVPPLLGDRASVVGAGMVGCCVARLLAAVPGADVELVDVDPARAAVAERLGVAFATPEQAREGRDVVYHASATGEGLACSLELLAPEGRVAELSWYGDRPVTVPLGEYFHSRRLTVRASQVGTVGRPGRTHADRIALALDLLADPAFDALIGAERPFDDLPALAADGLPALCTRIAYP
ncbi:zinc-dependent alcohol dehydrogenase [Actinomadura parmotrematis]|uniref:Zinc-binding alcohol dehydrogenase n=1 Tax=Actinomadura parmotrematis TaxID=2864039 RepID=A0ABS7FP26_9ACTN|nr:zinc-binding alcohol dehydrogenase [Actinomadura parmotrematis]MBW8481328.1 zinc-binding alcohol dehydrogenase [Actinomadura parmotrematis]